jgi:hypothetical protein
MPLWSNVLLVLWNSYYNFAIERLTNNPGENWFDQIKESLKNFLPVMPSQYANFLYSLVEAYFEEFSALKLTSLKKYPDFNNDATINWSKGCERIRRQKDFYGAHFTTKNEDVFDNSFAS